MALNKEMAESTVRAACLYIGSFADCHHCGRVAVEMKDESFAQQWFFLDRARACVHLGAPFRKVAKEATETTARTIC